MEKVKMFKNSPTYGFVKGETFNVLRNVNGFCVIIFGNNIRPNLIMSERKLRSYGNLTGKPEIGG